MTTLNIIDLIEKNPITKLNATYNNKLINKIKTNFTETQQQLFVSSFYCYLNYDKKTDFVIDLDDVWKFIGFNQKIKAAALLEKNFTLDIDYKCLLSQPGEQKKGRGGHNKQIIMMNIKTFKLLCIKAGTKKADEIHEYFINMEEMIQEIINEETDELKLQLQNKDKVIEDKDKVIEDNNIKSAKEKQLLFEETLISQFPLNTQCIYYGKIDNKSGGIPGHKMYHEDLIKFGQSNNLSERIKCHRKSFINFQLVGAFKVKNKVEIENCIKKHKLLKKRIRSLTTVENADFKNETYRELLALDDKDFTIEKMNNYFLEIIKENEYNIENYNLLLKRNDELEDRIRILEDKLREEERTNSKMKTELDKFQPDITTDINKRIASNFAICKYSYYLYAFENEPMKFKCSMTRQKDYELVESTLKSLHKDGSIKYKVKVIYPFSEKIMIFLLKQSFTMIGTNNFQGSYENVKRILDITAKLEVLLIDKGNDLELLDDILSNKEINTIKCQEVDPEAPVVRKARRAIDQINKDTGEVIATFAGMEAAGRSLGLTTGTAIGMAVRDNRACQGFLWRYTGISKEEQFGEQPVIKVNCSTGEKTKFKTIAAAAKDADVSAPALRYRILSTVHCNDAHWIFDKTSTHYK